MLRSVPIVRWFINYLGIFVLFFSSFLQQWPWFFYWERLVHSNRILWNQIFAIWPSRFFFLILHYSYWIRVSGLTCKEHNYTRLLSSSQKTLWSQYHSLLILFFFFFLLSSYVRDGICVSSFRRGFRQWLRPSETNGCDSYLILVEGVTTLDLHFWWPRYLRLIISKEEIRREKVNKPTKEKNCLSLTHFSINLLFLQFHLRSFVFLFPFFSLLPTRRGRPA